MPEGYMETPLNFREIEEYVTTSGDAILEELTCADRVFFYDTCAFRLHANMESPEFIFQFIEHQRGAVVVTRCVLMELASYSGSLNGEYIRYFEKLHMTGVKVLLMYEEDFFHVLELCFNTNAKINSLLSCAVRVVKSSVGTVETVLKEDRKLLTEIMGDSSSDSTLFKRVFGKVRSNKEQGDNLGEELLCIVMHMLSNMPDILNYRYLILTDDKGAIGWINRTAWNVWKYNGKRTFSALSMARLAQRLFEEGIVTEPCEVERVLNAAAVGGNLRVLGSGLYDLEPKELRFSSGELAERIVKKSIHINY